MKSVQEALDILLHHSTSVQETQRILLQDALGRVLANDLRSEVNVPPMDNTQMDGYAVRVSDIPQVGSVLKVGQRIPAGYVGQELAPGTVARIFTGASIPKGANAVIMQEQTEVLGDVGGNGTGHEIRVLHLPKEGEWIRKAGEDIASGGIILEKGTFLRPQELGVAASAGFTHVEVFRRLKVALFFTGDELTLPGEPLKPGGIYNSNRDTLIACVKALGCEFTDFGIVPDTLESTKKTLRQAALEHDVIVTSGGVSVGEEDHIRPAVTSEGRLDMWQIAMKPGKPLAFGAIKKGSSSSEAWFFGLPGNPVSSFVTFLIFVRPFIHAAQGRKVKPVPRYMLPANFDWNKPDKRNEFLRCKINAYGQLDKYPNQSSGVLTSASWGDGLADIPAGQTVQKGDMISFIPFSEMLN